MNGVGLLFIIVTAGGAAAAGAGSELDLAQLPEGFDAYSILGLDRSASRQDIKRAYRKLASSIHPDTHINANVNQAEMSRRWEEVSLAYEILGTDERRRVYDSFGTKTYRSRWEFEQSGADLQHVGQTELFSEAGPVKVYAPQDVRFPANGHRLVDFYAPWCVHCQQIAPQLRRVALELQDEGVEVGAVNCERHQWLCRREGVGGYPTLRLLSANGMVEQFHGQPNGEAVEQWLRSILNDKVVEFADSGDFQRRVFDGPAGQVTKVWLLAFSTHHCGPCQMMRRAMRQMVFKADLGIGVVQCERMPHICDQVGMRFFPYVVMLKPEQVQLSDATVLTPPKQFSSPAERALDVAVAVANALLPEADVVNETDDGAPDLDRLAGMTEDL